MAAIPTGQDNLDASTRLIHVSQPGDYQAVNPVTDGKRLMVPFGTQVLADDFIGTILSGTIQQAADKKERPDGVGGVEAITFCKLRWEVSITATFKVMRVTSSAGAVTAGVGPLKIGDQLVFNLPNQGETFAAAGATTQTSVFTAKTFTIDDISFKFSDGEYATYDIKATHNVGLHQNSVGLLSAEVEADGDVVQYQDGPLND